MSTNHQMNYYDYGKDLDIQGVMSVIGGGVNPDPHEYVDLGLPSGTLWATENIKDVDGNELYFAWGETQGYTSGQVGTDKYFVWEGDHADYKYGTYDSGDTTNYGMTKYNSTDGLTVLEPEDDAATVNWGEGWRMPTKEEIEELISSANTTMAFIEQNGGYGLLVTSKVEGYEGNSVLFPGVGIAYNGDAIGAGFFVSYWSASVSAMVAWRLIVSNPNANILGIVDNFLRCSGYSVRPVRSNN